MAAKLTPVEQVPPPASVKELQDRARAEVAAGYERAVAILAADPYHPALPDFRLRLRAARLAAGTPMAREVR